MISYIIWILAIILLIAFIYINYRVVFISKYTVESKELPEYFDGYRVVHISDWHETMYGKNNHRLIKKIKKLKPDIIFLTGDLVVKTHRDIEKTKQFLKDLNFCKSFYVSGNHELMLNHELFEELYKTLEENNVTILDNRYEAFGSEGSQIHLYGIMYDTTIERARHELSDEDFFKFGRQRYTPFLQNMHKENFNILLVHDPLNYKLYADLDMDLIYSGHLHGGGIRLFGYGLAWPKKKIIFSKLAGGIMDVGNAKMIISRGCGNSAIPVRIFNPPEISLTILKSKK